jgi:hypothetical protein
MIVSPNLMFQQTYGRTRANMGVCPQKRARDFGEAPTPDYEMAPTVARQSQSLKIRRAVGGDNRSMDYVPLKCDQYGSHAEGSSVFNAPAPYAYQLNVPAPVVSKHDASEFYIETFPSIAPPLMLKRGLRPEPRPIKFDNVAEPANDNMTRIKGGDGDVGRIVGKTTTFDVGLRELRRLHGV